MKSFFKKSAISLVVLGFAGSAMAAVPMMSGIKGYFLGVEGLDFKPGNGDLDYVTLFPASSNGAIADNAISPSYHWGFRVFGGLKFGDNDDVTLSWQRLHTNDSASNSGSGISESDTTDPRWLGSDYWEDVHSKVDFDLDDVTLVMGHTIHFNNPWTVRFAGGLEYAKINSNMTVSAFYPYDPDEFEGTYSNQGTLETKGIGPRVEFDAGYQLPYNFSLFMNSNAALLISKRSIDLNASNPPDIIEPFQSIEYSTRHVVVPKLGLRLGVNYAIMFGNAGGEGGGTVLNLNAGWEFDTYIHAIERPDGNDYAYIDAPPFAAAVDSSFSSAATKTSNFSVQGLFLGVNVSWM